MKTQIYSPMDLILVKGCFHSVKMVYEINSIHEGAGMWLFSYCDEDVERPGKNSMFFAKIKVDAF